ncbi:MAG: hypothetical protein ISP32_08675 [Thermoleophilia bacterium]|nr:hypothetical protein [Thermoleophilia bacterium]
MSTERDMAAMRRVIAMTGLSFPRGLLGPEAMQLAAAIGSGAPDRAEVDGLIRQVATAQWPVLQGPMAAALARADRPDDAADDRSLAVAEEFAADADPHNPLALALAERAGLDLAAARARAQDRLEALAGTQGTEPGRPEALVALATAAGRIVVDLLDLDPEDFAPEISDYADAGTSAEAATPRLVRATGDDEIRAWAREAVLGLDVPAPPMALASVKRMAEGPVPEDPADDVLWTAAMVVLAEDTIDMATAEQAAAAAEGDAPDGLADLGDLLDD